MSANKSACLGSSPGSTKDGKKSMDAKKVFQKLRFGSTSHDEYTVGFMQSVTQNQRASGATAWSQRVHDVLQEFPFSQFLERFVSEEEDIPFHRIAYFKHRGVKTWESDYYRKKAAYAAEAAASPFGANASAAARRSHAQAAAAAAAAVGQSGVAASPSGLPPLPPGQASGSPPFPSHMLRSMYGNRSASPPVVGGSSTEGSEAEDPGGASDDDVPQWQLELDGGEQVPQPQSTAVEDDHGQEEQKELPEACWMAILCQLSVRDVCMAGRVNRWLHQLSSSDLVWKAQHRRVIGEEPPPNANTGTLRRTCRRSALRAARWLEADVQFVGGLGFPDTTCLQLDDGKVVSADGNALRLWSHAGGRHRRIATLLGHAGRVTAHAHNEEQLISGCTQCVVKVWSMDDLKCQRTLRGHEGPITGIAITGAGIPVSSSEDGRIRLWDVSSSSPVLDLETAPVLGLTSHGPSGFLVSTGTAGVQMWDVEAASLLHTAVGSDAFEHDDLEERLQSPFSCVAYNGNLLAAGSSSEIALWDSRTQQRVGSLKRKHLARALPSAAAASASGAAAAAAAAAAARESGAGAAGSVLASRSGSLEVLEGGSGQASSSSGSGCSRNGSVGLMGLTGEGLPPIAEQLGPLVGGGCCGVQLDEWKLAVGYGSTITLHDIRTAGASFGGTTYREPFMVLQAPARVNCFQFHQQQLLAGLETQCCLWSFQPPPNTHAASHVVAELQQMGGLPGGDDECLPGRSPGEGKTKKKATKQPKQKGRYPKRTTK